MIFTFETKEINNLMIYYPKEPAPQIYNTLCPKDTTVTGWVVGSYMGLMREKFEANGHSLQVVPMFIETVSKFYNVVADMQSTVIREKDDLKSCCGWIEFIERVKKTQWLLMFQDRLANKPRLAICKWSDNPKLWAVWYADSTVKSMDIIDVTPQEYMATNCLEPEWITLQQGNNSIKIFGGE